MGEGLRHDPRHPRPASRTLRMVGAVPFATALACLSAMPAKAQESLADDSEATAPITAEMRGEATRPATRPAREKPVRAALPPVTAETGSPGQGTDSFSDAFEPLAQAPRPDLALPEGAVDLSVIEPEIEAPAFRSLGTGTASFYGRRFHGRRTANGERFDMNALTAAHRTLPFGSMVRVTNPSNGRSVTVRINDRGPFSRGRVIDVSRAAAKKLGLIRRGHAPVQLELLE